MADQKRFCGFISYSQKDKTFGKRLHRWLETYRVPAKVSTDVQLSARRRLGRFFRDDDEISAATDIAATVRGAIEESENLIVLCSPRSAKSQWVNAEVAHFRETRRGDRIFAVIIDGVPNSGDPATECFPPLLRASSDPDTMPVEPLGIDLKEEGRRRALARLVAGLINVPFDDLWRREKRRVRKRRLQIAIAALSVLAGIAVTAALVQDAAHRQDRQTWSNTLTSKAGTALHGIDDPTISAKLASLALEADPSNAAAAMLVRNAFYEGLWSHFGRTYSTPFYREIATGADFARLSPDGLHVLVQRELPAGATGTDLYTVDGDLRARIANDWYGDYSFSSDGQFLLQRDAESEAVFDLDGLPLSPSFTDTIQPMPDPRVTIAWEFEMGAAFTHAYSADGRTMAGMNVTLWSALGGGVQRDEGREFGQFEITYDGELVNVLPGIWRYALMSSDGNLVITASDAGTVTLWGVDTSAGEARRIADLWQGGGAGSGLPSEFELSRDNQLMVVDDRGVVRVWNLLGHPLTTAAEPSTANDAPGSNYPPAVEYGNERFVMNLTDVSGDTLYYRMVVEHTVSGATWQRTISAEHFAMTEDVVAVFDNYWLYLIDPHGIEELRLPMGALHTTFDSAMTADKQQIVIGPNALGLHQRLPMAVDELIAAFGPMSLSASAQARWDVASIVEALDRTKTFEPDEPLHRLLWRSARDAVAVLRGDPSGSGPVSADGLPASWQSLVSVLDDALPDIVGWLGHSRGTLSSLRGWGVFEIIDEMGAPDPFLDGPHTVGEWDLDSNEFARYNPAYIRWLEDTLVPDNRDDARRRATQYLYNGIVRRPARIHALALAALDENPELREAVAREYAALERDRVDFLLEALAPVASLVGPRPEGEPEDLIYAAGFWIRRDIGGTTNDFRRGLDKLLRVYDPDFNSVKDDDNTTQIGDDASNEELVRLFWHGLSGAKPDGIWVFGTRNLYSAASGALTIIAAMPGVPEPFLSGPHDRAALNLDADTFGHYNPVFVRWAYEMLIPRVEDTALVATTAPIYERSVRDVARAYLLAHELLRENPDVAREDISALARGEDPGSTIEDVVSTLIDLPPPASIEAGELEYNYYTALGFWLRRSVDGTRDEFKNGLRKLLLVYDPEFLAEHDATDARSTERLELPSQPH